MGPLSENLAHLVVSGVELYAVGEMDAAQEVDISEWAMIARVGRNGVDVDVCRSRGTLAS